MRKAFIIFVILLCANLVFGLTINITRVPGGPPIQFIIDVINDSEPPVEITDFHFSVSMPCQVVDADPPPGWTLRYALPNSFVEMDAGPGAEIPPGGVGTFGVTIDGPCEDATYSLYFTSAGGVIPGSEREGPIEGLNVDENATPSEFKLDVSPNPFNSGITISVSGEATLPIQIEIYDINGRKVTGILANQRDSAKPSSTDASGACRWTPDKSLGSGIYLVRAKIGDNDIAKRVVYLK